jgi:protein phosphatase 2C family protein 2/3
LLRASKSSKEDIRHIVKYKQHHTNRSSSMGLSHAVPVKETENGSNEYFYYASSSMQGYRPEQEDSHCNQHSVTIDPTKNVHESNYHYSMFGVFDGHAGMYKFFTLTNILTHHTTGWMASDYCSKNLVKFVVDREENRLVQLQEEEKQQTNSHDRNSNRVWSVDQIFTDAYVECDRELRNYYISREIAVEIGAGTTSISVWCKFPTSDNQSREIEFICANVGDSRAILYDVNQTVALSEDHKPTNALERERIEKAGKVVHMGRVNGNLAVARAFGDFRYKDTPNIADIEQAVSVEPEMKRYLMTPSLTSDDYQFVVLACDGLWDKMTNGDVSAWILTHLKEYHIFDESVALTDDQMEPLQHTWLDKHVSSWNSDDYAAWVESVPTKIRRHFRTTFQNGSDLATRVQSDELWNELMEKREGISHSSDFDPEEAGKIFRKIVLDRIAEQEARLSKREIRTTVDKLTFLTERLIDYSVFKKRSEDNVSVTIILLKKPTTTKE